MDVEGAYRTIPVHPASKRFLIIKWKGKYYLNHDVPFGLNIAHGLQGEVADAIIDLLHALGIGPGLKWVDDFVLFRDPVEGGPFTGISNGKVFGYAYDDTFIFAVISPLGVPWHKVKRTYSLYRRLRVSWVRLGHPGQDGVSQPREIGSHHRQAHSVHRLDENPQENRGSFYARISIQCIIRPASWQSLHQQLCRLPK